LNVTNKTIPALLGALLLADASAEQAEIDEVLVTATRRSISTAEISSALTLIDGVLARTPKLVTDALDANVGVFVQQTTPGQGAAIIRGLKGSAVLHLVDGVRLNNAIFRSAPTQYFALVPTSAVEQIEVLRGTPASLYGSDAVGGVVQLVTRVPKFNGPETQFGGEIYAAFDSAELGKILRGTLDAGNQSLSTSISAEIMDTGDRRTGSGDRIGPSGYESKAARWMLSGTPVEGRSWLVDMHYLEQAETPRVDELVPGFGQTEPSSSEFLFAPNRRVFVRGGYGHEAGWLGLDWNVDFAWQRIDDDRITRDLGATERRRERNRSDLFGLVAKASQVRENGSWVAGIDAYLDEVSSKRSEEDIVTGRVTELTPRFPDGSEVQRIAAFANGEAFVSSRNVLSGGLRISYEDVSLPQTPVSEAASVEVIDASGDIGWIFNATDTCPGNRFNIPNTDLDSERVVQFDVGVRYRAEKASIEVMLYALDYDDRITSVLTGELTPEGRDAVQSVNAAESTIRGVEAGADMDVSDAISLGVVLNYTWGEQEVAGSDAEPADRVPPLTGRLNIVWQATNDLRIEAWTRFADRQDRLSARDVRDVRIDPNGTSGWGIFGLRASWDYRDAWQLTLGVDNILDKRYRMHGSGLDAPGQNVTVSIRRVW
jgi:outer membrane receptor protein involved in Fe transport